MRAQQSRPTTIDARGTALRPARNWLRNAGTLAFAAAILTPGWSATTHAWTVEVKTPTITVATPTITVPNVAVPTIATPNIDHITNSVEGTVANVQSQVQAVTAGIASLPATVAVDASELAAQVTGNVDTVVQNVTAATNTVTATINGQGLAALVNPGLTAARAIQLRTDVVTLASGSTVTVDFYGDGLINFAVDGAAAGGIGNNGAITIASADISRIVDNVINVDGITHSQALSIRDGQVALVADLAPAAGAAVATVRQQDRSSSLAIILSETTFRPGGYNTIGRAADALNGNQGNQQNPLPIWAEVTDVFFGTVEALAATSLNEEQQTEALTVIAELNQLETLASKQLLAPTDVCQAAGGGGVGLPGCAASETFGAEVTLAPEETGAGCALMSAGSGIRLSCGGVTDELPFGNDFGGPGSTGVDPAGTLQDLLDEWLNQPNMPDGPFIASTAQDNAQIAAAAAGLASNWY